MYAKAGKHVPAHGLVLQAGVKRQPLSGHSGKWLARSGKRFA